MREIIGQTDIQPALTEARQDIQQKAQILLQKILTEYQSGIEITEVKLQDVQPPPPVIGAFNDVPARPTGPRAPAQRGRQVPQRHPAARPRRGTAGDPRRPAYKERLENEAEGEAQRFLSVYNAYKENPDVTTRRMYLETLQDVLSKTDKVILDPGVQGAVPYLPLNELRRNSTAPRASSNGN